MRKLVAWFYFMIGRFQQMIDDRYVWKLRFAQIKKDH